MQVRLDAATHRALADEVSRGQFRLDLYHRLAVIALRLPPLRKRPGDVPLLVHEFLRQERPGEGPRLLAPGVLDQLATHAWSGNVRELRNAVSRALAQGEGPLTLRDFLGGDHDGAGAMEDPLIRAGGRRLADIEREAIQLELARQKGNRRRTAAILGVARSTLGEKLRKLGLAR